MSMRSLVSLGCQIKDKLCAHYLDNKGVTWPPWMQLADHRYHTISTLDWHHDTLNSHRYSACNFHLRPTAFKLGSSFCIPHFHVSHTKISSGSLGNGASFKYLIFIPTQKVQNSFLPDAQGQIQAWEFIWEDGFKKSLKKSLKRKSHVDVKNILIVLSWSKGRPKTQ